MNEIENRETTKLLTIKKLAERWSVSDRWVWQQASPRGSLPTIRLGRNVRIDPAAADEWLKAQPANA